MILSGIFYFFSSTAQIWLPYVMPGFIIAEYITQALAKFAPHVDWDSLVSERDCIWTFSCTFFRWVPQFNFGSRYIPRTRIDGWEIDSCPCISIVALRLCFLVFREKWISWYFTGVNFVPCVFAHSHILCCCFSMWQFSSVEFDHTRIFVSSTNPTEEDYGDRNSGRRVLIKNRKSIGDSGNPWDISVGVGIWSPLNLPRMINIVLSFKIDSMKSVIHFGIPFVLKLWITLLWGTFSKAPAILRLSKEASLFLFCPHIVCICSVSNSTAEIVDLLGLAPVCSPGRRFYFSAILGNRLAMSFSITFPIVISSAIGRYAFATSYLGFGCFFSTFVFDS